MKLSETFLTALHAAKIGLHPTDTVPGLCFDPSNPKAYETLIALKGRDAAKSFICLVGSFEQARRHWQALPASWEKKLQRGWPRGLSIVWQAVANTPQYLLGKDQTLALRVPHLAPPFQWFAEVLKQYEHLLPSTSVNISGQPAARDWREACAFAATHAEVFVPKMDVAISASDRGDVSASTLILVKDDRRYEILREGFMTAEQLKTWWNNGQ